jgi:DNA-binding CsgD family transcriptional regulator
MSTQEQPPREATHELSPREAEIVELAIQGLTNEGIAHKLNLSVGTVNTYWLRIRLKVGGLGRTDSVAKVIKDRAEKALREANVVKKDLAEHMAEREARHIDLRAEVALLQLAMDQIKSTVWATDKDLRLQIIANGLMPSTHCRVLWEVGKTVFEIFKNDDPSHPPIAAHIEALKGRQSSLRLEGEFSNMVLRAMPMLDGEDHQEIIGCIGIMNVVGE